MENILTLKQQKAILCLFDMIIVAEGQIDAIESRFEQLLIQKFNFNEKILIEPNDLSKAEVFEALKMLKKTDKDKIIRALEKLADSNLIRTKNESKIIDNVKRKLY